MTWPCEEVMFTCGETRPALERDGDSFRVTHNADVAFVFTSGAVSIPLNTRYRQYTYSDEKGKMFSDIKYVVVPTEFSSVYEECANMEPFQHAHISEKYTTVDSTFLYADLRSDLFVYKKETEEMKIEKSSDVLVSIKTPYDDAYRFPFIIEDAPIDKKTEYICTSEKNPINESHSKGGYGIGIRILTPLFNGGIPYGMFTYDGIEYDAEDVDWYYLPNHYLKDGDNFFWWADWHKSMGVYNDVDTRCSEIMVSPPTSPYTEVVTKQAQEAIFYGSAAVSPKGHMFFSAVFGDGGIKHSFLKVDGDYVEIPTDKTETTGDTDAWFPIAPV